MGEEVQTGKVEARVLQLCPPQVILNNFHFLPLLRLLDGHPLPHKLILHLLLLQLLLLDALHLGQFRLGLFLLPRLFLAGLEGGGQRDAVFY